MMIERIGLKAGPSFLEKIFFKMSNPWQPTIAFAPAAVLLFYFAWQTGNHSWWGLIGFFLLGALTWTFVEYLLHRFVYHWKIRKEPFKSMVSGLHLAHHRDADDIYLVFSPLIVSALYSVVLFFIFLAITQSWTIAALMMSGLSVAYIYYEWLHFGAHHFKTSHPMYKYLRKHHLAHHFKNPKKCFGVTNPFWDMVFRTHMKLGKNNTKN
ncbi:MAG: sterol desaturase family protein [Deltaproteobacteria bacterium]|nr:sterol desaturase family protein [Deltaproteobacteria bacterium]